MPLPSIQDKLDELDPGGTLKMERGDYGHCVLNKPAILLCDGATFWTDGSVPAVKIQSTGVVIKDANLRSLMEGSHRVIEAEKDNYPLLQNIRIFGQAVGIESEPSEWVLPTRIDTGEISHGHPGFFIDLAVPQRSQIVCRISGVSMDPSALNPGINTVKLQIQDAMPDSILIGEVEVIGSVLTRLIPFFARITATTPLTTANVSSPLFEITTQEKERFQKNLVGSSPTNSSQTSSDKTQSVTQSTKQKTEPSPATKSLPKKSTLVSKPADRTQANLGKLKSTPAAQEDSLKLGGAFGNGERRRLPVYVLADCSESMSGDPIESMSAGISALHGELMNDPSAVESAWMSVIAFNSNARQINPLSQLSDFVAPKLSTAKGRSLGAALELLSVAICREVRTPDVSIGQKGDWKPLVFIITDGPPTDDWQTASKNLKSVCAASIISIACGDNADTSILKSISDTVLEMKNMSPSDFSAFFKWVTMPLVNSTTSPLKTVLKNPAKKSGNSVSANNSPISTKAIFPQDPLKLGGAFVEHADEVRNYRRIPIYILADCSGAMSGDSIESIMAGISAIHSELMNDPTAIESAFLSVITFGSHAKQVVPLTEIASFAPPKLEASGARAMGEALRLLCQDLDLTASQQKGYKADFNPIIFLLTGGIPTDDWQQYADDLKAKRKDGIIAVACGDCGDGAYISLLKSITDTVLDMKNMIPSDYSAFLKWFSDSGPLPQSETISTLPAPGHTSIDPNSQGKPSPLFVGNAPVDKPVDPSNRTEADKGQTKGDHNKAPQTSQLSKLFTDPSD